MDDTKEETTVINVKVPTDVHRNFKIKCAKQSINQRDQLTKLLKYFNRYGMPNKERVI